MGQLALQCLLSGLQAGALFALLLDLPLAQLQCLGLLLLHGPGLFGRLLPAVLQLAQLVGLARYQTEAAALQGMTAVIRRTGMVLITMLPLRANTLEYRRL